MNKLFFILGITFLAACSGNKETEKATTETKTETVAQTKQYACPMKCEGDKKYDQAGKCPVCKMDLEEVAMAETEADSTGHTH